MKSPFQYFFNFNSNQINLPKVGFIPSYVENQNLIRNIFAQINLFLNYLMLKNYHQEIFMQTSSFTHTIEQSFNDICKPNLSPPKKAFARKPAVFHLPLTKKRSQQSFHEVDSTMQQTNLSQITQSDNLRFISCRSPTSKNNSVNIKSSLSLSFANSLQDINDPDTSYSMLLTEESMIGDNKQKWLNQSQPFLRKKIMNVETSTQNKRNDNNKQLTELETSLFQDVTKSFYTPYDGIIEMSMPQLSNNISMDQIRRSNSSSSLIQNQVINQCQECDFHQRGLRQLMYKNKLLERIMKNKNEQIARSNKKLQQNQKKTRQLERKVKDLDKMAYQKQLKSLQEKLANFQQQCSRIKQAYSITLQQLKSKKIENSTLKKFQAQYHKLEKKMQTLVTEKNERQQRFSSPKVSARFTYTNYPSSLSKQPISKRNKSIIHNFLQTESEKKRRTYTSRNQQEFISEFGDWDDIDEDQSLIIQNSQLINKKTIANCFDDSYESEIISLSEESNY